MGVRPPSVLLNSSLEYNKIDAGRGGAEKVQGSMFKDQDP